MRAANLCLKVKLKPESYGKISKTQKVNKRKRDGMI